MEVQAVDVFRQNSLPAIHALARMGDDSNIVAVPAANLTVDPIRPVAHRSG